MTLTAFLGLTGLRYLFYLQLTCHFFIIRYCLSCLKTLNYPLYKVSTVKRNHNDDKSDDVPPEAFLMMDNLMFEVFRSSQDSDTDLTSKSFSKRNWECEFHKIYDWASVRPILCL